MAILGAAVVAGIKLIPPLLDEPERTRAAASPTPSRAPSCVTRTLPSPEQLGSVAWVRDGALEVMNLTTCETRTVVEQDATPPVRFSSDGAWLAFGEGSVVPAEGGDPLTPIGTVTEWAWVPGSPVLVGVTAEGGLVVGGPAEPSTTVLPEGSGAAHPAVSPDGTRVAVDVVDFGVQVVDLAGGEPDTLLPDDDEQTRVAGWTGDGEWVLFSVNPDGALTDETIDAFPLNAAPVDGGNWINVFHAVLPVPETVTACGDGVVFPGGAGEFFTENKQLLVASPPEWDFRNASDDFLRSWIWAACSPDGSRAVATASPNRAESVPGTAARSLWVVGLDGSGTVRLTGAPSAAFEAPRWSSDGLTVLVVRRQLREDARGALYAFEIDPETGETVETIGPLAELGSAEPQVAGRFDWSERTDWFRPPPSEEPTEAPTEVPTEGIEETAEA